MKFVKKTEKGRRETNQDYLGTFVNQSDQFLAVICDGLGGHNAGDVASEMAVLQLGNSWRESAFNDLESMKQWLIEKINKENRRIFDAASIFRDLEGMGTTLVAAAVLHDKILIANIGDSRAYNLHNDQLQLITKDHSFVNELLMHGQISEEEAQRHEKKNTLTRSLGVDTDVVVDFFELSARESTYILLCSDGLTSKVSEEEMQTILVGQISLEEKVSALIELALEKGATDNISLCIVQPFTKEKNNSELKGGEDTDGSW